jgi:hypothetical protein
MLGLFFGDFTIKMCKLDYSTPRYYETLAISSVTFTVLFTGVIGAFGATMEFNIYWMGSLAALVGLIGNGLFICF